MSDELTSRERIRTVLELREPDRIPMTDICFWPDTVERWRSEGLPQDQTPEQYFDLDVIVRTGLDCSLQLDEQLLEETDEWTVTRNRDGAVHRRWKSHYATCAEIDQLIKTREDWRRYRDRLQPSEDRIPEDVAERIAAAHGQGRFTTIQPNEPVWWILRTLGMQRALITMATDPVWFEEMMATQTEMQLALCRRVIEQGPSPDAIWFFSDLCYRNGMFFSPRAYRELMMPYHRRFAQLCHDNDMFLILHCDGDCREFLPLLIEAGFDAIQPLEARCGNDVRELKPRYGGSITFFGNMNMDVYASGDREAIRHEVVSKLEAAMPGGGYIYHSDHSVPPTVSFHDYAYAHELLRERGQYG